jgi:hypothetical protein
VARKLLTQKHFTHFSSRLKTAFGYVPNTRPDPPSLLRQLAYEEGSALPGPEVDPKGWKTLGPFVSRGVLSPNHAVGIKYTVSSNHFMSINIHQRLLTAFTCQTCKLPLFCRLTVPTTSNSCAMLAGASFHARLSLNVTTAMPSIFSLHPM